MTGHMDQIVSWLWKMGDGDPVAPGRACGYFTHPKEFSPGVEARKEVEVVSCGDSGVGLVGYVEVVMPGEDTYLNIGRCMSAMLTKEEYVEFCREAKREYLKQAKQAFENAGLQRVVVKGEWMLQERVEFFVPWQRVEGGSGISYGWTAEAIRAEFHVVMGEWIGKVRKLNTRLDQLSGWVGADGVEGSNESAVWKPAQKEIEKRYFLQRKEART